MLDQPDSSDAVRGTEQEEVAAGLAEFCNCFNAGDFYEAHDALEVVWLPRRRTAEGELWKGLIQLAAAFVHVQRGRQGPALSLLRSSIRRLKARALESRGVDLAAAIALAETWESRLPVTSSETLPGLLKAIPPTLRLKP